VVVVETGAGTNVLGGDVGVWFGELGSGTTEGQRRVLALGAPTPEEARICQPPFLFQRPSTGSRRRAAKCCLHRQFDKMGRTVCDRYVPSPAELV
jgi:hypothetical protein